MAATSQAPDTGNAEIIAHYGTPEQKTRYLEPLLQNEIVSAFSMTEPQGGSDPTSFVTRAEPDGEGENGGWKINGEKWFSTNGKWADFLIVMAVTDPDAPRHQRMSMFIVPVDTPGVEIVRNVGVYGQESGSESYIRYTDVQVPADHLLGERGGAFAISQTRLGGGRVHHAMRTVGSCKRLLDAMSRETQTRYLIVTHNAVTMSRMHRLFGVTMVEQGVSRLVSVDLGMAEELVSTS